MWWLCAHKKRVAANVLTSMTGNIYQKNVTNISPLILLHPKPNASMDTLSHMITIWHVYIHARGYCWFMQNCGSVVVIFVSLLCAEVPGIGMCRCSVRMWVIWELANTVSVSKGLRLRFKNHIQTDIIIWLHLALWGPRMCHILTHTQTDPLFIPLNREWPRLSSNKGVGFTSGTRRGGLHPCRPLHCLFALEPQTLWNSHSEALHKHWGYLQRWF